MVSVSALVILYIHFRVFLLLVDKLGLFPLMEEDAGRGERKLDTKLLQLVAGEFMGHLVVERCYRAMGYIIVMLVHFVVLAPPLGEEAVEDVGGHETVELDALRLDRS